MAAIAVRHEFDDDRALAATGPVERDLQALGVKEDELKAIDKKIKDIVVAAAKFAEDAPEPEAAELYTDVLVESY